VIELGREIYFNDKQNTKHWSRSEVIEIGISIDSILNSLKHLNPNEQIIGWIKIVFISSFNIANWLF
jgi:hypothetical protein